MGAAGESHVESIDYVIVIAGGTAGWSAAACLARFLAKRPTRITLVDSSAIGTVGVGEASVPDILTSTATSASTTRLYESTQGTFKLGIRFDDWREHGSSFSHSEVMEWAEGMDFHQCLASARTRPTRRARGLLLPIALARAERFAQPVQDAKSPLTDYGYAFHFDAGLYARRLKRYAVERGVVHIDRRIEARRLRRMATLRRSSSRTDRVSPPTSSLTARASAPS
jgi:tryptophan halogenase